MNTGNQKQRTYLGIPISRPKVAFFELSSCEGCQLQLVNNEASLIDFLSLVEVRTFREAMTERSDDYEIAFVEGSVTRADEIEVASGSLVPFQSVRGKLDIGKAVTRRARRSIELDSTFGPAYMVLGIIYREGARLKWYERVIANVIFGGSLPGTIEESESMLLKSIELDPHNIFAYYELSRTFGQMGNMQKRKECLEKIHALSPQSAREKEEHERASRQLERLLAPPQQ